MTIKRTSMNAAEPSLREEQERAGVARLVCAVLDHAVRDAADWTAGDASAAAQSWLFDDECVEVMSFRWCCQHLGLEPDYLRRGLRRGLRLHPRLRRQAAAREEAMRHRRPASGGRPERLPLHQPPPPRAGAWVAPARACVGGVLDGVRGHALALDRLVSAMRLVAACSAYVASRNAAMLPGIYGAEREFWPVLRGVLPPPRVPSLARVGMYVDAPAAREVRGVV